MSNLYDQIIVYLIIQILEKQAVKENIKECDLHNSGFRTHF